MQITEHFHLKEFLCKDGSVTPVKALEHLKIVAEQLEVIRQRVQSPLIITNAYRSPSYNDKVGGVKGSFHLQGKAVDFYAKNTDLKALHRAILELIEQGKIREGGVGYYPKRGFIHYDIRGYRSRWTQLD